MCLCISFSTSVLVTGEIQGAHPGIESTLNTAIGKENFSAHPVTGMPLCFLSTPCAICPCRNGTGMIVVRLSFAYMDP